MYTPISIAVTIHDVIDSSYIMYILYEIIATCFDDLNILYFKRF